MPAAGVLHLDRVHRIAQQHDPSDANAGVLSLQLRVRELLQPDEQADAVLFDTDFAGSELPDWVDSLLRQLGCTPLACAGA